MGKYKNEVKQKPIDVFDEKSQRSFLFFFIMGGLVIIFYMACLGISTIGASKFSFK
ncbi:hypothetical protein HMPREF0083_04322 [Aneurinibacillus aneurinilyticus ATCC 12856]|uniref:Uncharacterized protein n=1 Tax=Aneurinibacillus aneurinilyticus ATCC 12856 TaxID=649747 RepID=U1WY32_ANEAE|nr:hypothetical protein HMPREF0083_04322 [Aneurinibacillus aneurinilyticus ATCC 12856]